MAKKIKLRLIPMDGAGSTAQKMCAGGRDIFLTFLPRQDDFIKDTEIGYVQIVRVVHDVNDNITLVVK